MTVVLERWNDDRMDALAGKVDDLGGQMDQRFEEVNRRFDQRFESVENELREQRREMKAGFERIDDRFERMQRLMVQAVVGLSASFITGFTLLAGLIATQ